jgi:hypothetical protein
MYLLNWKTLLGLACAVLVLGGRPPRAAADPLITVFPSVAPNKFGSPSWPGYVNNAVNISGTGGIQNGGAATGNPASPTFYSATNSISTPDLIVTNFPSWRGFANPGSVFGPAFANEFGNRLTFGLYINGNGSTFTINQVDFDIQSNDPNNVVSFSGGLDGFVYDSNTQNTIVGRSAISGNLVLDPAPGDPLTELWYVGPGVAFEVDDTDPGATLQDKINNTLLDPLLQPPNAPFDITATFTLDDFASTGSATVAVTPSGALEAVPEPTSALLLATGVGLAGALSWWRRRRGPSRHDVPRLIGR